MPWFQRRRTPEKWFNWHASSFADMGSGRITGARALRRRVNAQQGLVASGVEAIPFALRMLDSPDAEIREDAGGILAALGRREEVVPQLLSALAHEHDDQARDSLVMA